MSEARPGQEIGKRFRAFRESLNVSRSAFALSLGIGTERLASYESGRAPLPYFVFKRAAAKYLLNPFWLSTGEGASVLVGPYDDAGFAIQIEDRSSFLDVYQRFLKNKFENDILDSEALAIKTLKSLDLLMQPSSQKKLSPDILRRIAEYCENIHQLALTYAVYQEEDQARLRPHLQKKAKKS